jgi:hypothetical protein
MTLVNYSISKVKTISTYFFLFRWSYIWYWPGNLKEKLMFKKCKFEKKLFLFRWEHQNHVLENRVQVDSAELERNRLWPSWLYTELLGWPFFPSKIVWIGLNRPIHPSYCPSLTDSWLLKWFLTDSCCNDVTVIQLSFDFWIKRAIGDSSIRSTSLHSVIIKFLLRNMTMFLYWLHSPLQIYKSWGQWFFLIFFVCTTSIFIIFLSL